MRRGGRGSIAAATCLWGVAVALALGGAPKPLAADAVPRAIPGTSTRLAPAAAKAALDELARTFVDHEVALAPEQAVRLGMRPGPVLPLTSARADSERAWHARFAARIEALADRGIVDALSSPGVTDWTVLADAAERASARWSVLRPDATDPAWPLVRLEAPLHALLRTRAHGTCNEMGGIARRLGDAPEVLRTAQVSLTQPTAPAIEAALHRSRALQRLGRVTIGEALATCREPSATATVAAADTQAMDAIETYRHWLEEAARPRAESFVPLGPEGLSAVLGLPRPGAAATPSAEAPGLDALWQRLDREATLRGGRADSLTALVRGNEPAAYDSVAMALVRGTLDSVRTFLAARRELALPERNRTTIRPWRRAGADDPLLTLLAPFPGDGPGHSAELRVALASSRALHGPDSTALKTTAASWRYAALHEGVPGRLLVTLAEQRVVSRLWRLLADPAAEEAWCDVAAGYAIDTGFHAGDAGLALERERHDLRRLGRLAVEIAIHARGLPVEEAQGLLERRFAFDPRAAAGAVNEAVASPGAGRVALEAWAIEDRLARAGGANRTAAMRGAFAWVLSRGALPLAPDWLGSNR